MKSGCMFCFPSMDLSLIHILEKRRDRKAEALKAKELSSPKTEGEVTIQEKENEDGEGQAGKEKPVSYTHLDVYKRQPL